MKSASAIATVLLMAAAFPAWSQKQFLNTVQALDEENKGVFADVVRIFGDGREEWLAKTNQNGIAAFKPAITCDFNHRIRVRPDAPLRYQQPDYQKCGKTLSFLVKRWGDVKQAIMDSPDIRIVENLWAQAEILERKKNHASLPIVYTELSTRLEWTKSPLVKQLREQAYFHTAKALDVKNGLTYDEKQGASVMSPGMIIALKDYQLNQKISATGRLDKATLQSIAKQPYSYFLYDYARPLPMGGPDIELSPSEIEEATAIVNNLETNVQIATSKGDHALALMLYTEMTQRYWRLGRIQDGRNAEQQTFRELAEVLQVKDGAIFDPVQDKYVMSPALVTTLYAYQEKRGLSSTGRLDYRTVQELSGKNVSPYLYNVVE